MQSSRQLSVVAITGYCITTAVAAVWIAFSFPDLSPMSITFFCFLFSFFVIVFIQSRSNPRIFRLAADYPAEIFLLNLLTLFSWLFAFMALRKIEPSLECAVFQGMLPIAVLLCELISRRAKIFSLRTFGILLIGANLFLLLLVRLSLEEGIFEFTTMEMAEGLVLAGVGGASAGVYAFRSGLLHSKTGCSTMEMLCNRFFLLLIVTGLLGLGGIVQTITADIVVFFQLIVLALISVLIPMFALQYSIRTIGASRVSIITPSVPIIALGIEQVLKGWPSMWVPILIATTSFSIFLANYWMSRDKLK